LSRQLALRRAELLRFGRDAGVAANHAPILEPTSGTKKQNLFSLLGLFHIY
jgi:hypothetical protein